MKKAIKKTVTKAEKKEIHEPIPLRIKDWNVVAHVVKISPNGFEWFGFDWFDEPCITDTLFINKYGSCIGCVCICVGCGTVRVMDPDLYEEFIGSGGMGW